MKPIRVMIVDDHEIVREGLRQLLETAPRVTVVAEAEDGLRCLDRMKTALPDVVFMDVSMPGITGIEATRLITRHYPSVRVIMLTIHDEAQHVAEAIRAGAMGYVLKTAGRADLVAAMEQVLVGRAFLDPSVASPIFEHMKRTRGGAEARGSEESLTIRETEVLSALARGLSDRAIAEALFVSGHTVRSHIKSIFRKLRVSSRCGAVASALRRGMIEVTKANP